MLTLHLIPDVIHQLWIRHFASVSTHTPVIQPGSFDIFTAFMGWTSADAGPAQEFVGLTSNLVGPRAHCLM